MFLSSLALWRRLAAPALLLLTAVSLASPLGAQTAPRRPIVGALQSSAERAPQMHAAGITLAEVGVSWNRFEPEPGKVDEAYRNEILARIAALRAAGQQVALDFGLQYPPRWVLDLPNGRYQNQFGDRFADPAPGMNGANAVWNQAIRDQQAAYVASVFRELGTEWHHVRLGWGWYGELNYPRAKFDQRANCYWAYDDMAQGKTPGLPPGIPACPVPGWVPGQASQHHRSAGLFLEWYLGALKNYHDWQIATVRRHYRGDLAMLYPSWGIRPGQKEAAVAGDLDGATPAEKNGEVPAGLDFARFVSGIQDDRVLVYTTWLDAPFGDDATRDPVQWTPGHYLAFLAFTHPLKLRTMGENTGGADETALLTSLGRVRQFQLEGLVWAFEPQLFDGRHVSLQQFQEALKRELP